MSVPMLDVVADVLDEAFHRIEGAAAYRLAGEDSEPRFDHVQPRGTGGREVEADIGMVRKPLPDLGGGVRGGVVQDHMHLTSTITPVQQLQETQEVRSGVSLGALSEHLARGHFERRVKAGQSVAPVVVGLACRQIRPQRQHRLGALQRLNLGLLIHTQDHGVGGRIEVEPDHIADLRLGVRIGGELEALHTMGLERMRLPDPVHGAVGHRRPLRDLAGAPVRQTLRRALQRQGDNSGALGLAQAWGTSRSWPIHQPGDAFFGEAPTNPADLNGCVPSEPSDFRPRDLVGHQQHGSGPAAQTRRGRGRTLEPLQFHPVSRRQLYWPCMVRHDLPSGRVHGR